MFQRVLTTIVFDRIQFLRLIGTGSRNDHRGEKLETANFGRLAPEWHKNSIHISHWQGDEILALIKVWPRVPILDFLATWLIIVGLGVPFSDLFDTSRSGLIRMQASILLSKAVLEDVGVEIVVEFLLIRGLEASSFASKENSRVLLEEDIVHGREHTQRACHPSKCNRDDVLGSAIAIKENQNSVSLIILLPVGTQLLRLAFKDNYEAILTRVIGDSDASIIGIIATL